MDGTAGDIPSPSPSPSPSSCHDPRLVFTHVADEAFEAAARPAFPHAEFRPRAFVPLGPTLFVAHDPAHVEAYDAWFPGLTVRARSCLRHRALEPGSAVYLPVTYDSWVAVVDGAGALGAALEAARSLRARTVVVPAFAPELGDAVREGLGSRYRRCQDRILPHT